MHQSTVLFPDTLKMGIRIMELKILVFLTLLHEFKCQQDFTRAQIPTFRVGTFFPTRSSLNAEETERVVCRDIIDHIDRDSARFRSELVSNTNRRITFQTVDGRLMSSRMQSRLDTLQGLYRSATNKRMTVLKAWTPYPDTEITSDTSLHFEGRSVSVTLPQGSNYNQFLRLAVEAGLDWVYYELANRVRLSVIPSNCARNVDMVFMLDRSGSVGSKNHKLALQFMSTAVSFFTIGLNGTRVGVVPYSGSASIAFDLDAHTSLRRLQNAIERVSYTGGATNTPAALTTATTLLNPTKNRGARPNSEGIPKIAILITDGKSNRGNIMSAVTAIRTTSIQVYAIGIANINRKELQLIATDPDDEHVFILRSYLDAAGFVDFLSVTTCDTPAVVDTGDNTTTETNDGGTEYFQTTCAAFSRQILVELTDVNGTSFLFASAIEKNPGPLTMDTVSNTTTRTSRRTAVINLPVNSKVVYIGVQGQTDTDSFNIVVWDLLFDPEEVHVNVVDGVAPGTLVYDAGLNLTESVMRQSYKFSIIDGNQEGSFAIDQTRGHVYIGNYGINVNQHSAYRIIVQAQSKNHACQRARIRINIQVISSRIRFNSIPTLNVSETAIAGSTIAQIMATGGIGTIQYSIIGGNEEQKFSMDSNMGTLSLNRLLNYESTQSYRLLVRAMILGTTSSNEVTINIEVEDVNEQPFFTTSCATKRSGCSYSIDENLPAAAFGSIVADDPDLSAVFNGMLVYQLSVNSLPFSIESAGRLKTTRPLDRETRSSYTFTLTVRDSCNGCSLSVSTTIRVTVTDVNDNPPVFTSNPTTLQVSEDLPLNTPVAEYRATDADVGSNAVITFTLAPNTVPFSLSPTGTLSLTGSIDYETTQSYSVTITASNPDGTNLRTTSTVTIQILNVNDNTPVITGEPYVATVPESSAAGTVVTTITATDGDLGIHGEIRYFITSGNFDKSFTLDRDTGSLTVNKNLDRELASSFTLAVRVRDKGTPQTRRSKTTISITVSDVNDNGPIFRPDSYSVQLREDISLEQNVIRVLASDADQPNTTNSDLAFSILSGNTNDTFKILSNGQIKIKKQLDFETTPSYSLIIGAEDGGFPIRSATATVMITVISVNQNPPTLTGDQSVNVSEATPVSSRIAVFHAQDQDNMAITLSIISGNAEGKFAIDPTTGAITLVNSLDYETITSYILSIRASDGQRNTDSTLTVFVEDSNEFSPVFQGQFVFMVSEGSPAVTLIGTVIATDGDRDAEVTYKLVDKSQAKELFHLDSSTGHIVTDRILDLESLSQIFVPPLSQVTLQVAATDNGSPSRQSFRDYTITLVDINDNAPIFTDTMYTNQLRENLPSGQVVFSTSATDDDLGTNAEITYSFTLTNNLTSSNPFQIDSATGTITTTMPLDCELQPFYLFSITATDAGSPPMSSSVTGNLSLIDENDNQPKFSQDSYQIVVREDFIPGVLTTFTATDEDKGVNGELEYSILQKNTLIFREGEDSDVVFEIDGATGTLRSLNLFDYELNSQVNVTVFVNDRGLPRRTASATLIVMITNVDEEPPAFDKSSCDTRINENVPIGTKVITCSASDTDSIATGNEQMITYSLTSFQFEVNPFNGTITTKSILDRERNGGVGLILRATDSSGLVSIRRVNVIFNDNNDNAPQFQNTPYKYHFTDESIHQHKQGFLTISAIDPDLGENGTVTLKIGKTFLLSDTETKLEVIAEDGGTPTMKNTANVTVTFQSLCQLQTYTISSSEGRLTANLLCSIEMTPSSSFTLTLGHSKDFSCRIHRNHPVMYQWLHNGTALTNPVLAPLSRSEETFSLTNISYSHSGEYACRASSLAGGLQSSSSAAIVQVIPVIITEPVDVTVQLGAMATFNCLATGTPTPRIEWFIGTRSVGEGNTLAIPEVTTTDATTYTCIASNAAGNSESASAQLIIFDEFHVVQMELTDIDNPSSDGSCQYFDPSQLKNAIQSVTTQKVAITSVSGTNLCDLSPCSPSPCKNGGNCIEKVDVKGHYECTFCRQGYTGVNCTDDVNECDQGACGGNGFCSNTEGSFTCRCDSGFTGRRCQYEDKCSSSPCTKSNEVCVEVLTVQSGYQCRVPRRQSSLEVKFGRTSRGQLDDLIQAFLDRILQTTSNSQQTSRRKRQASNLLITSCEPRFVPTNDGSAILLWACPTNTTEPNAQEQQDLCQYLFEVGVVSECKLPNGEMMEVPTAPSIPATNVEVDLVLLDGSNKPMDARDSVKTLQDEVVQEQLAKSGVMVFSVAAQESRPRPMDSESGIDIGIVTGSVLGGVIIMAFLVLFVILTVSLVKKRLVAVKSQQQKKKRKAQQMLKMEMAKHEKQPTLSSIPFTSTTSFNQLLLDVDDRSDLASVQGSKDIDLTTTESRLSLSKDDYDVLPQKKD